MAAKSGASTTTAHPVLLQFVVGFLLVIVAAWFSNISDETGNIGAGILAMMWILFLMKNNSFLAGITPKGA